MNSKEVLDSLKEVRDSIACLLCKTQPTLGEIDENIKYEDTADERMLENEIYGILDKLSNVKECIEYIQLPIKEKGILRKNGQNYYEMINSKGEAMKTYHAGDAIEVLINEDEQETWVWSRLEHNGDDYYIFGYSQVRLDGLHVRER